MDALLEQLLASPLVYLLIAGSIAGSAVFPPLPSESMLITAMGFAAAGSLTVGGWPLPSCSAAGLVTCWRTASVAFSAGQRAAPPLGRAGRRQRCSGWKRASTRGAPG